ncbi:MAG: hypothetical protein M3O25_10060 [Actinomycetota bacterium]|nr:hypothetical protein [Actinomycetota bacterium]
MGAALAVLSSLAAPAVASAGISADSSDAGTHQVGQSPQQVIDHWTPKRLRDAAGVAPPVARTPDLLPGGTVDPQGTPVTIPGMGPAGSVAFAGDGYSVSPDRETSPAGDTEPGQRIHGRVFATLVGVGDFSCSGTVIASPQRNVVVTAGHCVFGAGTNNQYATNWVFVPGYRYQSKPYGIWPAAGLLATRAWVEGKGFAYDVGMAQLKGEVENTTGSAGVAFNQSPDQVFDIFGYPARPNAPQDGFGDYDGERLIACEDAAFRGNEGAPGTPSIGAAYCYMQQGSSGGAWMLNNSNVVNSVVSHGYCQYDSAHTSYPAGQCGLIYGPYFGSEALDLYNAATLATKSCKRSGKARKAQKRGAGKGAHAKGAHAAKKKKGKCRTKKKG